MTISVEQEQFTRPDIVAQERHMLPDVLVDYAEGAMSRCVHLGGAAFLGYIDEVGIKEVNEVCVVPLELDHPGQGPSLGDYSPYGVDA